MQHKIHIKNFGPIKECDISINQFNVFTGPQSNGKSTIAKAIYYFRTIKRDILNIMQQGGIRAYTGDNNAKWKQIIYQSMREKFLQIFGTSWVMPNDMELFYDFCADGVTIKVTLKEDVGGRNCIYFEFGRKLEEYLNDLQKRLPGEIQNDQTTKEKGTLERLFNDPYEIVFIPAGRNLITLLTAQLNYIFTSLESSQLRNIDYITKRYTELILRLKPSFNSGMDGYIGNTKHNPTLAKNYKENKNEINLLCKIANDVLQGKYSYIDGEERMYIDSDKYIKINFASSGQQEIVWVFNLLFYYLIENKKVFLILEEPESHLYPESQRRIGETLGLFSNANNNQVLITTHSPYLLGTFNYMMLAGQCKGNVAEIVNKQLSDRFWVLPKNISAHFVKDGHVENAMESDEELILIKNELIDGAAEDINEISDFIIELNYEIGYSDD